MLQSSCCRAQSLAVKNEGFSCDLVSPDWAHCAFPEAIPLPDSSFQGPDLQLFGVQDDKVGLCP